MTSLLIALVVAATGEPSQIKLASPGLKAVNISDTDAAFYSDHFAQQLKLFGLQVVTANDISTLLGTERQKQLLGCGDDSSSCVTELAGALGADGTVTGSLGKFGPVYQINLSILSATNAQPLAVYSSRVTGEEPLLEEFTRAAKQMTRELFIKSGRPLPESLIEVSAARKYFWIPVAAGAVVGGAGGYLYSSSVQKFRALQAADEAKVGADSHAYAERGRQEQLLGIALMGVGTAGLITGVVMYITGAPPAAVPTVTAGSDGAAVSMTWVLP